VIEFLPKFFWILIENRLRSPYGSHLKPRTSGVVEVEYPAFSSYDELSMRTGTSELKEHTGIAIEFSTLLYLGLSRLLLMRFEIVCLIYSSLLKSGADSLSTSIIEEEYTLFGDGNFEEHLATRCYRCPALQTLRCLKLSGLSMQALESPIKLHTHPGRDGFDPCEPLGSNPFGGEPLATGSTEAPAMQRFWTPSKCI